MRTKFRLWHVLLMCGLLGFASNTYAPPPAPRYALVIGNARHADQRLGMLRTARNDAEDVGQGADRPRLSGDCSLR